MAPNTHTFTHTDYRTTLESWPGHAPYRSVLACVQNKLGLSVGNSGGLRPCCLAGAEGAAGCQWSVPAGASGNGVTLALTPVHTPASSWVQGPGERGRERAALLRPSSWTRCRGWAHFGHRPSKEASQAPDVWAVSMKSLAEHRSTQSSSSSTVSAHKAHKPSLETFGGSTKARVMTGRGSTS